MKSSQAKTFRQRSAVGHKILAAIVVALFWCAPAGADETRWTPEMVLQRVGQEQPEITAAKFRKDGAASYLKGAGKQPNPQIKLSLSGGTVQEDANALTQRFEIAGQPALRKKIASSLYEQADRETLLISRKVALESLTAYYQVWMARRSVEISAVDHQLSLQLEEISRRRFATGDISQDEYRQARLQSSSALASMQQAASAALAAEANFRALIALPDLETLYLPSGPRPPVIDQMLLPLKEELSAKIDDLPEIEIAEARAQQAKLEADLASKASSPDLYVYAYRADYSRNAASGIQFGISFPLFDWGELRGEHNRKKLQARSLQAEAEASRRTLKAALFKALELCRGQTQYVQLLETQLQDRKILAEHSLVAYELGLASLLETITTQKNYQTSLFELAQEAVSLETQRTNLHLTLKETLQ